MLKMEILKKHAKDLAHVKLSKKIGLEKLYRKEIQMMEPGFLSPSTTIGPRFFEFTAEALGVQVIGRIDAFTGEVLGWRYPGLSSVPSKEVRLNPIEAVQLAEAQVKPLPLGAQLQPVEFLRRSHDIITCIVTWLHYEDEVLVEQDFIRVKMNPSNKMVTSVMKNWSVGRFQSARVLVKQSRAENIALRKATQKLKKRRSLWVESSRQCHLHLAQSPRQGTRLKRAWVVRIRDTSMPAWVYIEVAVGEHGKVLRVESTAQCDQI